MSLFPQAGTTSGSIEGIAASIGDHERRLSSLETIRTFIRTPGSLQPNVLNLSGGLSTLTPNLGSITAGSISGTTIDGSTITGGTIRTSSSTSVARIIIDGSGLRGYTSGSNLAFDINTSTGTAYFSGIGILDPNSIIPTTSLAGALPGGNVLTNSSFEQGVDSTTGVDSWSEGWTTANTSAFVKNTSISYHGLNCAQFTANGANATIKRNGTANYARIRGNTAYVVSAATNYFTTARNVMLRVMFYNNSFVQVGSTIDSTPVLQTAGGFTRISNKIPAASVPTTAAWADVQVLVTNSANGEIFFVDAVQMEEGDVLSNFTPRVDEILYSSLRAQFIGVGEIKAAHIAAAQITADKLNFTPGGGNMLKNSGYVVGSPPEDWTTYALAGTVTLTRQTTGGPSNGPYAQVAQSVALSSRSGMQQPITNVIAGEKYSVSLYALSPTAGRTVTVLVDWKNSAGTVVGTASTRTWSVTSAWARYNTDSTGAFTAPATATQAQVYFWFDNVPAAETNSIANVQIEPGERSTPWRQYVDPTVIDGSTITGGMVRTAASGSRVQLTSTGIAIYEETLSGSAPGKLSWYDSNAVEIGSMRMYRESTGFGYMQIRSKGVAGANPAGQININAEPSSGNDTSIILYGYPSGSQSEILVKAGTASYRTLLNSAGDSMFVQAAGQTKMRIFTTTVSMSYLSANFNIANANVAHNMNTSSILGVYFSIGPGGTATAADRLNVTGHHWTIVDANNVNINTRFVTGTPSANGVTITWYVTIITNQ